MSFFNPKIQEGEKSTLSEFFGFSRSLARREIIKPYMNPMDSSVLVRHTKPKIIQTVKQYAAAKGKKVDEQKLDQFISDHLLSDIYSLYYNEKIELEKKRDNNKVKYKIIENVNDYLSKVITNHSPVSSMIFTEEIGSYLGKVFVTELTEEEQKKMNEEMKNTNGSGEGKEGESDGKPSNGSGNAKLEKKIEHGLDGTRDEFEKHIKQAQQKIKDIEKNTNLMDEEKQGKDNLTPQKAEDISNATGNMSKIKSEVETLEVNKHALEKAVEKILDKSTRYFSAKYKSYDIDLLDAQEVLDIDGLEYLHPIFQKTMIPELTTSERKYFGKFDLYIDHSGSMSSSCGLQTSRGRDVSRTLLAKAIALRMRRMGILNKLYLFDDSVTEIKNTELNILLIGSGGGTRIENVLKNIKKTNNNSVVLTDGDDYIETYLNNAFFVGVSVGTFHNFQGGDAPKYLERAQCCIFNGHKVQLPTKEDIVKRR